MWTLFLFELRHVLRDLGQVVLVAVVVPMLLAPFTTNSVMRVTMQEQQAQKTTYFVSIVGGKGEMLRQLLPRLGRFRDMPLRGSPEECLREGLIDCYLTVEDDKSVTTVKQDADLIPQTLRYRLPTTPVVTIHFASRERSQRARMALEEALDGYLKMVRNDHLRKLGENPSELYRVEQQNLSTRQQEHLQTVASLVPIVLIFVFFGTGSVTALDAIAGERERGSLATLLVSAISRRDIAVAKWLTVVAISLAFGVLQFVGICFTTRGLGGTGLAGMSPLNWILLSLFALLLCLQVSALLLWISVRSSTFKQAQLLYMPALLVAAALSAVSWMQSLPLRSVVVIVPVSGLSLAVRDVILSAYSGWLLLAALVSLAWTALTLHSVSQALNLDDLDRPPSDSPAEQDRALLGQDVYWFYALAAAAMIVLPGNFPQFSSLRGQVLLNQGLMLVLTFGLLRLYRQPTGASLRLGGTSLPNWVLCLLAAPLVHFCANSVAIISSWLVPMSEDMVRQMTQLLLPENASAGELFFLLAVCPAVCEELAFRGCFLHSVQKPGDRLAPSWATCLLVGCVFGAFHFSLQRLLATSVIGTLLTYVALRTGSIWPCMLLHLANNGLAVGLNSLHLEYTEFPAWSWLAAWALLIYLLKRLRNPAGVRSVREEKAP